VLKCLLSPDMRQLATISSDKTVKLWNVDGFTLDRTLTGGHHVTHRQAGLPAFLEPTAPRYRAHLQCCAATAMDDMASAPRACCSPQSDGIVFCLSCQHTP
jgi:cytochrome P450